MKIKNLVKNQSLSLKKENDKEAIPLNFENRPPIAKPDSYTTFKNKIGLTAGGKFIDESDDVVLDFPYKDCVLIGGQTKEDKKRKEIFLNETLCKDQIDTLLDAKTFVNAKRITSDGEESAVNFKETENFLIKGNNLLVISSLLKRFENKVKCIYIDVPFNTGSDSFKYNDNFNHSAWLVFMKNRLEIAKKLLKDDGIIFIHCDNNEESYLKNLCDIIFLRENFNNTICLRVSPPNGVKVNHANKKILKEKEYILVYKKSNQTVLNPIYKKAKEWDSHFNKFILNRNLSVENWKVITLKEKLKELEIKENLNDKKFVDFVLKNRNSIFQCVSFEKIKEKSEYKQKKIVPIEGTENYAFNGRKVHFLRDSIKNVDGKEVLSLLICDFWDDVAYNNLHNEGGVKFKNGKKPEKLIKRILDMSTSAGDLILDFFVGSGTTCAVAHKLGRHWIGVEQMDYVNTITLERIKNVIQGEMSGISKTVNWRGGGSFVYCELAKCNQKFVDAAIAKTPEELNKLLETVMNTGFINSMKNEKKTISENIDEFKKLDVDDKRKFIIELLDKNMLYVNFSDVDDEEYKISEPDKLFTKSFYSQGGG